MMAPAPVFRPPKHVLAPYVATPDDVVDRMLRLAGTSPGDVVYDLGCGDGRVPIRAALAYGARGVGVDIEPYWVEEARRNASAAGVGSLVRFEQADALDSDLSLATVVVLYLVPWSTQLAADRVFAQARPGTRIVSHGFPIESRPAASTETFVDAGGVTRFLGLWVA